MIEIERKFLVTSEAFKSLARSKNTIAQGYLNSHPERTVRVRIKGESGFLTIKGNVEAKPVEEAFPSNPTPAGAPVEKKG